VILFGFGARGDPDDSDLDFLVIEQTSSSSSD